MRFGKDDEALERRVEASEAALRAIVGILAELPATRQYVSGGFGNIGRIAALQPYAPEDSVARAIREAREATR